MTVVLAACGAGDDGGGRAAHDGTRVAPSTTAAPREDIVAQADDVVNLHTMTKVRGFYADNRLGHLDQTLAIANSPQGDTYPVGTILQLLPQEAMW